MNQVLRIFMAPGEKSTIPFMVENDSTAKHMDFITVVEMLPCDFYEITYGVYFGNSFIFAFLGSDGAE